MAFGAPALGKPLPVGAVGGSRVACRDQQEEESEAKARDPSILMLHRALPFHRSLHTDLGPVSSGTSLVPSVDSQKRIDRGIREERSYNQDQSQGSDPQPALSECTVLDSISE